jgi:hypothetical protein
MPLAETHSKYAAIRDNYRRRRAVSKLIDVAVSFLIDPLESSADVTPSRRPGVD